MLGADDRYGGTSPRRVLQGGVSHCNPPAGQPAIVIMITGLRQLARPLICDDCS